MWCSMTYICLTFVMFNDSHLPHLCDVQWLTPASPLWCSTTHHLPHLCDVQQLISASPLWCSMTHIGLTFMMFNESYPPHLYDVQWLISASPLWCSMTHIRLTFVMFNDSHPPHLCDVQWLTPASPLWCSTSMPTDMDEVRSRCVRWANRWSCSSSSCTTSEVENISNLEIRTWWRWRCNDMMR